MFGISFPSIHFALIMSSLTPFQLASSQPKSSFTVSSSPLPFKFAYFLHLFQYHHLNILAIFPYMPSSQDNKILGHFVNQLPRSHFHSHYFSAVTVGGPK